MELTLYQIDTFTNQIFQGNAAAVCPLREWLSDEILLKIAAENNLSETAFYVSIAEGFHIRWFTPVAEVVLCGHATLASAFVLFNHSHYEKEQIVFESKSGKLIARKQNQLIQLDFPAKIPLPCNVPELLIKGLAIKPKEVLKNIDYIVVYETEKDILNLNPNFEILRNIETQGICVTAPGKSVDFVSRFFAPRYGINEDPVTGSSHCELVPYWAKKLNKNKFTATQLSKRKGSLECELINDRVLISGQAITYMEGKIHLT